MLLTLIILYIISLIYISIVERFRNYASIIAIQGWILLGIALLRLHSLDWVELSFIVIETLVFKALIVPAILTRVINQTRINRIRTSGTSQFNSLMLSVVALIISAIMTYYIADSSINMVFFGVALYAIGIDSYSSAFAHLYTHGRIPRYRERSIPLLDGYRS